MPEFISLASDQLSSQEAYDLLASAVVPRPIAFVSTISTEGIPNLAPFSFFMAGGSNPPSLAISVNKGTGGRRKDTLRNIEATGEFVVNLVDRSMSEGMNATSKNYPATESEWGDSQFSGIPSTLVAPHRVRESAVQFECRLFQVVDHGEGSGAAVYVIGEVVAFHIQDQYLENGIVTGFHPISRLGGPNYLDLATGERFEMNRPS